MEALSARQGRYGKPLLSVVVPAFNEEQVIRLTHDRIIEVLGSLNNLDLEVVYVDDGSKDQTLALLSEIARRDRRVCILSLSRNFGHQPAITAGLRHASGDVVAVIDADLQDPMEVVPRCSRSGARATPSSTEFAATDKSSAQKILAYSVFYRLLSWLSDVEVPRDSGDFCLLDRSVVESLNQLPEKNRFVRGLRAWYGGRQIGVPYDRPSRAAGETRYPIGKLLNLAFDGIVSFSLLPLRLIFWLGLGSFIFAMFGLVFFLAHRIIGFQVLGHSPDEVPGFTSLMLVVLLLSGLQLLSIGILGEYLGRVYLEVKNRPEYVLAALRAEHVRGAGGAANFRSVILMSAVRVALGFAVAILFTILIARNVDLKEALGSALKIGPKVLAAAMLLVLLGYLVRAWRWLLMLRGTGVSATYWQTAPIFFSSFALNNVMPLRVGDVYRCWSATILQHATLAKSIASLLTERVLDLMSLAGLLGFLLLVFPVAILPLCGGR